MPSLSEEQSSRSTDPELDPLKVEEELERDGRLQYVFSSQSRQAMVDGVIRVRELSRPTEPDEGQKEALEQGPGMVKEAAPQRSHAELPFTNLNNYMAHFGESDFSEQYRQKPAYQRFAILYPDLNAYLLELGKNAPLDEAPYSYTVSRAVINESYDVMRQLVDVNDPYVTIDGQSSQTWLIG